MKICVLMENTPYKPDFTAEHGLSLYAETEKHKLLFDTGQTEAFAENAAKLGVDLSGVDTAVLSHGHYDHSGGLKRFLELNDHAPVYVSSLAFGQYYNGTDRYIGIDQTLASEKRLIRTPEELVLDKELSLCTCNEKERPFGTDSAGLLEKTEEGFRPDLFYHEQYLLVREENGRRILFSGCSHKGVLNICEWLKPDVFIGGFHFMKQEISAGKNEVLDRAAEILSGHPTEYYTGHCTGTEQCDYLKKIMGDRLNYLPSGKIIEI